MFILLSLAVGMTLGQQSLDLNTCCRDDRQRVEFKRFISHGRGPESCAVMYFKKNTLTIESHDAAYTSQDNGRHWRRVGTRVPSALAIAGNDFAQAPSDPNVLYKYSEKRRTYSRSLDGGRSWSAGDVSLTEAVRGLISQDVDPRTHKVQFQLAAVHPAEPLTVFATLRLIDREGGAIPVPGLYMSKDGGDTWAIFGADAKDVNDYPRNVMSLGISPSNPNVMYLYSNRQLVKSQDAGKTWQPTGQQAFLNELLPFSPETAKTRAESGLPLVVRQIEIAPYDPEVVFLVTNKGVYRSTDGGGSWCLLRIVPDILDAINTLAINADVPGELLVGTYFGLFLSEDLGCSFRKIDFPR